VRHATTLFLAIVLAALLAVSAYTHLENGYHFLHTIYTYQIVNQSFGVAAAAVVPFVQMMLALVMLFDRRGRRMAFAGSTILFAIYTAAQVSAMVRDLNISCGCFGGADDDPIGPFSIGLAAGACFASAIGAILARPPAVSP
jgi:MFS family permease